MVKNLVPLNLPEAPLKMARKGNELYVWDAIRKKHLRLTPEEWVRQHFVHFLAGRDYPTSAMALEGGFYLHKKLQRSDILVYKNAQPTLLVECKSPQVKISQNTFDQASRYNLKIKAPYVAVTNGLKHFIAMADHAARHYRFLEDVPAFGEL